jgi:ribonuclease P protein component
LTSERVSASFKRNRRLLEAKDFKRVFDENCYRSSNQNLLILAINSPQSTTSSRLGLVVAKKNARRAVDRNRIKRLTREYFRLHIAQNSAQIDFVVLAKPGINGMDNNGVRHTLKSLFDNVLRKANHAK